MELIAELILKEKNMYHKDIEQIVNSFESRRMQALKEIINAKVPDEICDDFLMNQVKALAILYCANKTKDYLKVDYANQLLMDFCKLLPFQGDWLKKPMHGCIMLAMRILILYEKKPELLYPETTLKLREGKDPDGKVNSKESLQIYIPEICYDPDRHIGLYTWEIPWMDVWDYTENHRLQITAHALLLCQIFKEKSYKPPDGSITFLRNNNSKAKDYWTYWKKSFYNYLIGYKKPRYPIEPWQFKEFKHMDWGIAEKDGTSYTHVFLGDFWMLRDLIDDPVIAKYSEMFIDLILADYAEEVIQGIFAGAHENSEKHSLRLPGLLHIYNHLLFDNLPHKPAPYEYYDWGSWGYLSLLTSDYNPSHPEFPKVIIDMAVNKPVNGYFVKEAIGENENGLPGKPKATWIMPDYSIGFGIKSWIGWGYHGGGVYVATKGNSLKETGLAILPFGIDDNNHFDLKYSMICPINSIVAEDAAITQYGTDELPAKIWIKDGFMEDFDFSPPWMFFKAISILNREIYIAIRPVLSGYAEDTPRVPDTIVGLKGENIPYWAVSKVPKDVSGKIIKFTIPTDYIIWEMGSPEFHPSFEGFKTKIVKNSIKITDNFIKYISCKGNSLYFDRLSKIKHMVNGRIINLDDYRYVINNPWGTWPHNKKEASFRKDYYSAYYHFNPNGTGIFMDYLPLKRIINYF